MLGFAGFDVQPMNSRIFAVWFVSVSGLEHFLKNMEDVISCPWHLSSSERNFSLSPALQLWHSWWWFEYVWMIESTSTIWKNFSKKSEFQVQFGDWQQLTSMMGYGWRCGGRTCWDQPGTGQPQDGKKKNCSPLFNVDLSNELLYVVLASLCILSPYPKKKPSHFGNGRNSHFLVAFVVLLIHTLHLGLRPVSPHCSIWTPVDS